MRSLSQLGHFIVLPSPLIIGLKQRMQNRKLHSGHSNLISSPVIFPHFRQSPVVKLTDFIFHLLFHLDVFSFSILF